MHRRDDGTANAKYLHLFDNGVWANVEHLKNTCLINSPLTPFPRTAILEEAKHKKKEIKEAKKRKKGTLIRNKQYSFTSFLIPLCITGERKDYQLLYCICALKNALKILSTTLRKDGFAQLYMVGMKSVVDWEKIKSSRISFTDIITEFLIKSGAVCMVAANKKEVFRKINNRDAPFIVLVAATDIQLPCQENLCVGTSWLVFRRTEKSRDVLFDREVYECGRRAIHAGVLVNGCTTTMTTAFKRVGGINHFIFDNRYGDFIMLQQRCFLRPTGNIISLNEALLYKFPKKIQDWLMEEKRRRCYHSRFTGGWLTDGYRILRSGGLLLSPEDSESNEGRIKYLYKALPLAFLAEKAGGKATNGKIPIQKMRSLRAIFTSLVLGSMDDVDRFMLVQKERAKASEKFLKAQDGTDSDETSTDFE